MLMSAKLEASFKDEAVQSLRLDVLGLASGGAPSRSGRPDLEACDGDDRPVVKIEAKLGAEFGAGQLRSYIADFQRRNCAGLLVVLVPRRRVNEICASTAKDLACTGPGPWRVGVEAECAVLVMSWEDLLDALRAISSEPFAGDMAQFEGMYLGLNGDVIEPVTGQGSVSVA